MRGRAPLLLAILAGLGCAWACGSRTMLDGPFLEAADAGGAAAGADGSGGFAGGRGGSATTGGSGGGLGGSEAGGTGGSLGGSGGRTGGTGGRTGGAGGRTGGSGGRTGGTGGSLGGTGGRTGGTGGWFGGSGGAGGSIFDAIPIPDSGPIFDCVSCAERHCESQVNACYNNTRCAQGFLCAAFSCGGTDINCLLGCFGDPAAMMLGLSAFLCLATNCGPDCVGAIGPMNDVSGSSASPPAPASDDVSGLSAASRARASDEVSGSGASSPAPASAETLSLFGPGGYLMELPAETAARFGLEPGWLLVPSIEVIDALPGTSGSCAEYGANCD